MKFQEIILALQKFWSEQGCILAEPYDVEKGAGTMNPSTFLRVLGPELGMSLMSSLRAAQLMAAMAIIRTVCTSIISSRSS